MIILENYNLHCLFGILDEEQLGDHLGGHLPAQLGGQDNGHWRTRSIQTLVQNSMHQKHLIPVHLFVSGANKHTKIINRKCVVEDLLKSAGDLGGQVVLQRMMVGPQKSLGSKKT